MTTPKPDAPLHERLLFDTDKGEVRDGPRRYLVMRPDVLMGSFDRLTPRERLAALQALGDAVTDFGGRSVAAYLAQVGPAELVRTMEAASASLGWGVWQLSQEPGRLSLRVENSPFAAGSAHGEPACYPIAGMLRAVAEALWGADASARELRCACQSREPGSAHPTGVCLFEAVRAVSAPPSSAPS